MISNDFWDNKAVGSIFILRIHDFRKAKVDDFVYSIADHYLIALQIFMQDLAVLMQTFESIDNLFEDDNGPDFINNFERSLLDFLLQRAHVTKFIDQDLVALVFIDIKTFQNIDRLTLVQDLVLVVGDAFADFFLSE